jgi:hypothetical protein
MADGETPDPATRERGADSSVEDRRAFIERCGRFAAITPPAVTFLLSTTTNSRAIAQSGGVPVDPGPVD